MSDSPSTKQRDADKLKRIPIKIIPQNADEKLPKPDWLRVKVPSGEAVSALKGLLREHNLVTVCEQASCPNLHECFHKGTATFMIMGDKCTRRCSFCDVAHGRPDALDPDEPAHLAKAIAQMKLQYVVITSVDRDDLLDGGAAHFARCIELLREQHPHLKIEILVPDFRGRMEAALAALAPFPPDVFNHNLETVPRLYKQARPGASYQHSLNLIAAFKKAHPHIATKSGLMLGLGESDEEILEVMRDLRAHHCDWLTLGQYLQPSPYHLPVTRYVSPEIFDQLRNAALAMGFTHVASGPLVRSSYHADLQADGQWVH